MLCYIWTNKQNPPLNSYFQNEFQKDFLNDSLNIFLSIDLNVPKYQGLKSQGLKVPKSQGPMIQRSHLPSSKALKPFSKHQFPTFHQFCLQLINFNFITDSMIYIYQ